MHYHLTRLRPFILWRRRCDEVNFAHMLDPEALRLGRNHYHQDLSGRSHLIQLFLFMIVFVFRAYACLLSYCAVI